MCTGKTTKGIVGKLVGLTRNFLVQIALSGRERYLVTLPCTTGFSRLQTFNIAGSLEPTRQLGVQ